MPLGSCTLAFRPLRRSEARDWRLRIDTPSTESFAFGETDGVLLTTIVCPGVMMFCGLLRRDRVVERRRPCCGCRPGRSRSP